MMPAWEKIHVKTVALVLILTTDTLANAATTSLERLANSTKTMLMLASRILALRTPTVLYLTTELATLANATLTTLETSAKL
jgi:hypothetical protein